MKGVHFVSSVTGRIAEIKQPRGGYLKPSQFTETVINDGKELVEENVHASIIGMAVDYLTRFLMGTPIDEAFKIPKAGYVMRSMLLAKETKNDEKKKIDIDSLLKSIHGLDDVSIVATCKAATYDVWFRNPMSAIMARGAEETNPDEGTINNIRVMVERSITFWEQYGPVTVDGFTFEPNGYTQIVDCGDGDFLTADTLWDFKVSKSKPTSKHTLQVLMYWIMGLHSGKPEYKTIKRLGIFNPRQNTIYLMETKYISADTIRLVEKEVICYD